MDILYQAKSSYFLFLLSKCLQFFFLCKYILLCSLIIISQIKFFISSFFFASNNIDQIYELHSPCHLFFLITSINLSIVPFRPFRMQYGQHIRPTSGFQLYILPHTLHLLYIGIIVILFVLPFHRFSLCAYWHFSI